MTETPTPAPRATGPVLAEVVARLGQHVVDVQHVGVEPEARVPPAAWFTIGGCAAVLGLGLMAAGLRAAPPEPDPHALEATADVPAEPAERGGAAGLGALLILLGVIPVVIGATARAVPRDRYLIGEGEGVHLPVPLPPGCDRAGVPLVRALEQQIVLGLVPGMTGALHDGERSTDLVDLLAQGRSSYALPPGARCEAALGALRFEISSVPRDRFVPERRPLDRLYAASNAGALAVLGALLLLGDVRPDGELELEDVALGRVRAVQYLTDVPPPPPPPAELPPAPKDRPRPSARPAAAPPPAAPPPASAPELAVEDPNAPRLMPRVTRRGRANDYDFARTAGFLDDEKFLASVGEVGADAEEGLLGYDNEEDRKMWAAVLAAPVINRPFGGLELAETERGGGIHHEKKIARSSGKKVEIDMYARKAGPSAEARAIARRVVSIDLSTPHIIGEMNSQTVLSTVRKQDTGLRRCFKEAVGAEDRSGSAVLSFKVNGDGTVKSANIQSTSTQLGEIGACMARVIRTWKFIPPLDRKLASVAIEFSFSSTAR